jgi:carboxymethylenebutenolidase
MGEMIEFRANGRTAPGYLARPASGRGGAVIVIQEWWGLVGHIKEVADRFATAGYFALAPDLYHGDQARSPAEADKLMMALDIAEAAKDLRGAATHLLAVDGVTSDKAVTIGFCMGGQLALFGACAAPEVIGGAIDFYGVHPAVELDVEKLSGPVQCHFGQHDKTTPPAAANALVDRIRGAGKEVEAYFYDAGHAFFNNERPQVYSPEAADLAWRRVLRFLEKTLS